MRCSPFFPGAVSMVQPASPSGPRHMPLHHRSALACILLTAAAARASQAQAVPAANPAGASTVADTSGDVIQAGRKIFHGAGGCYACHGGKLQGGPVAPPLTGPKFKGGGRLRIHPESLAGAADAAMRPAHSYIRGCVISHANTR